MKGGLMKNGEEEDEIKHSMVQIKEKTEISETSKSYFLNKFLDM